MCVSAICPGEDGDVQDLLIEGKGKARNFLGLQPEVSAQTHGRAGFCIG